MPANYPGNPFGEPANVRAFNPVSGINQSTSQETQSSSPRGAGDGHGVGLGHDGHGRLHECQDALITFNGWLSIPNMYQALNDPVHPYLLTGGNSAAQQGAVSWNPTVNQTIWNSLSFVQASGSRDLMQLDGGPLTLAIGAGDVYRNLNAPNPGLGQDGTVSIPGPTTYAVGSQNNAFAYVELAAPVTKNLELDAALRYDYYNAPNNNTWNPKVGREVDRDRSDSRCAVRRGPASGRRSSPRPATPARRSTSANIRDTAELPGQSSQRPARP